MKTTKRTVSILTVTAMLFTVSVIPLGNDSIYAAAKKTKAYKVVRIVDGDTIVIKKGSKKVKIRFIGVDTPESVHPDSGKNVAYGKIATKYTKKKLLKKKVKLEYGKKKKDRYGRTLAYVYYGKNYKKMINKSLLKAGHAKVKFYSPNYKYQKTFLKLEKTAKKNKKGLWKYNNGSGNSNDGNISTSGKYVGAITTYKFHFSSCKYVRQIKVSNRTYFDKRSDAVKKGYKPCLVCNP